MQNSLRVRLTLIFIGLAIIPLIAVGAIVLQTAYTAVQAQAIALQSQVAQNASSVVTAYVAGLNQYLLSLADQINGESKPSRTTYGISLTGALNSVSYGNDYEELTLLDPQGHEVVRATHQGLAPDNQLLDHSKLEDYLQPTSTRQAYYSPASIDPATDQSYFTLSMPMYEPGGGLTAQLSGVLIAKIRLFPLDSLLAHAQSGQSQTLYITDADGNVIAHQNLAFNLKNAHVALPSSGDVQIGLDRTNVVLAINKVQLGSQTFNVVAEKPTSVALSLVTDLSTSVIIAVLIALLLSAAVGFGFARQIVSPIEKLAATTKLIAAGNLSQTVSIRSRDEIGTLASAFNTMTLTLRDSIQSLEQRVKERTFALEEASRNTDRRAAQFEAIALVVKAINSVHQMDALLPQVTSVISERFGYYHVGIFLNNESDQTAVLAASNSEGGKHMLARGHRLKIGEQGIVGNVAATGAVRVARSVGEDAAYFNNPDLPETLSEMALPLRVGNQIVGVLDVQSKQTDAFSSEDIGVLSLLADEVSLAIDNTRLLESTRRSLSEAEALYRQYLRQAWSRLPREEHLVGYRYTISGSLPLESPIDLDAEVNHGNKKQTETDRLVVPIKLRGELIGNLVIQNPQGKEWSQDQLDFAQAVADRVALSAENARLFDETSRRAERERMVSEITSKIRGTNNPEEMINIALDELRSALGATEVRINTSDYLRTKR